MLKQDRPGMETFVREEIVRRLASAIDDNILNSTGSPHQPTGILKTTGVPTITFTQGNPSFIDFVAMESTATTATPNTGNLAYIINPAIQGKAKLNPKFPNSHTPIWETGDTINGIRTKTTGHIDSNTLLYGDFDDLIIGLWPGIRIHTQTNMHTGISIVSILLNIDFNILRPKSFCISTGVPRSGKPEISK
jgi:HK97 family phage major capsid protein